MSGEQWYCESHTEDHGEARPAVAQVYGSWLCEECIQDLALCEGAERQYQAQYAYAYACGYYDYL